MTMKSTLSRFRISSDANSESASKTENDGKIIHREEDEISSDSNNRNRSNSESSFITIDEDKEDSLLEFDAGSVNSDGYISESAIEDDGIADHLLLDSLKAQKDELINRLNKTISSVKNISNNKQDILVDTQPVVPEDDADNETLRPCSDATFPPGTEDVVLPEELPPVDTQETDLDVTEDRNNTIGCISRISGIPLPENTYVAVDRSDLGFTEDRNNTIGCISRTSGIPLPENTYVAVDRSDLGFTEDRNNTIGCISRISGIPLPENTYVTADRTDLGFTEDRSNTIGCISRISGIPLPENTYVTIDRTDLGFAEDRNTAIGCISRISGIPLPENTYIMADHTDDVNRRRCTESENFIQDIPETNDANDTLSIMFNDSNISTSTVVTSNQKMPYNSAQDETPPPAVRILQNRDGEPKVDAVSSKYEEAYASLSQNLTLNNETLGRIPTKELMKAIENQLENSLDEEKQMLESMRSQIDEDCKSFLSINNDDPLDHLLLHTSTDILENTIVAKDTIITVDSNDNTLECRDNNENQGETQNLKNVDGDGSTSSVIVIEESTSEKQDDKADGLSSDDDELAGTIINLDEDEEKLLASDDEQNVKEGTKSGLKEFVSQDPDENKDINDPKWEPLRKCKTDLDFFEAVRARWKNLSKPNPREDLTYHSKRRVYNRSSHTFTYKNDYGKRPHSPFQENNEFNTKIARRESCTYIFDTNIKNLMKNADIELSRINSEKNFRLRELAANQSIEKQNATGQPFNYFQDMKRRQIRETADLLAHYEYRQHCVTEGTKQKIAALNEASREVRQYFEFYYCDEVNRGEIDMCLTEEEKREIIELENMLDAYNDFYKPTSN